MAIEIDRTSPVRGHVLYRATVYRKGNGLYYCYGTDCQTAFARAFRWVAAHS